jgi:hypothetical protein
MQRKTEIRWTGPGLMDEVLFSRVDWPGKTVRLERDTVHDYCLRPTAATVSVAELFHENSKLFPETLPALAAMRTVADDVRDEFLRRRTAVLDADAAPPLALPDPWRQLLGAVAHATDPRLFYAVELRVLAGESLALHDPSRDRLQLIRQVTESDRDRLERAVRMVNADRARPPGGPTIFIVGSFARNDVLYGSRGYRRTLVEAGRVVAEVLDQAAELQVQAMPRCEFIDHEVDAVLDVDGTEEGTLVIVEMGVASYEP